MNKLAKINSFCSTKNIKLLQTHSNSASKCHKETKLEINITMAPSMHQNANYNLTNTVTYHYRTSRNHQKHGRFSIDRKKLDVE
ncbi:hypothetical protein HanPSC8_Chr09g0369541 [Helianthus annuus]|nr:hypothetical protein HanPSC8_Chr09g0369541 [Helianthus annuus]